jgi:hypothetical protein
VEIGPFIDDFPIKTSIYKGFSMAMLNNQMVTWMFDDAETPSFYCSNRVKPWFLYWLRLLCKLGQSAGWVETTIWLFNIAMERGPFIDGLPIENGDFPWLC